MAHEPASGKGRGMRGRLASEHYREMPWCPSRLLNGTRVEALWHFESPQDCSQWVLPDGRMDLVAHATCSPQGRLQAVWLAIAGPADVWSRVPMRAGMLSIGARFQVGWGGVCLGLAPSALRNRVWVGAPVAASLGSLAHGLLEARTPVALQEALVGAVGVLAERAQPDASHARALHAIGQVMSPAAHAKEWAQAEAGHSARARRRDVQKAAGLSLRTLAGVLRFQRAVALLDACAGGSLADLAVDVGYADQAHMTREFRRFGGFTPALPERVPVLGLQGRAA